MKRQQGRKYTAGILAMLLTVSAVGQPKFLVTAEEVSLEETEQQAAVPPEPEVETEELAEASPTVTPEVEEEETPALEVPTDPEQNVNPTPETDPATASTEIQPEELQESESPSKEKEIAVAPAIMQTENTEKKQNKIVQENTTTQYYELYLSPSIFDVSKIEGLHIEQNKYYITNNMIITINIPHIVLYPQYCQITAKGNNSYIISDIDPNGVFGGTSSIGFVIALENTNFSIDYINEKWLGIDSSIAPNYFCYSDPKRNGMYSTSYDFIDEEFMGYRIRLWYKDGSTGLESRIAQFLDIPKRPKSPQFSENNIQKNASSVTLPLDSTWEYRLKDSTWTNSNTFTGLKANTKYTFEIRKKAVQGTETIQGSFASLPTSVEVTTEPASYTVSIPSEVTAGTSFSLQLGENSDLGGDGNVTVRNITSVNSDGYLELSRDNDAKNYKALSKLMKDNASIANQAIVAELRNKMDKVDLSLAEPFQAIDSNGEPVPDNLIPAGNYRGTLTFEISYKENSQ